MILRELMLGEERVFDSFQVLISLAFVAHVVYAEILFLPKS
jgi:hypothetical protein